MKTDYPALHQELETLLIGRWLTDLANTSALLFTYLPDINWVGFYLAEERKLGRLEQLQLGPFQGRPACTDIAFGKGVCGTSAAQQKTLVVPDVHEFPGHIACDPSSRSEIVIPVIHQGRVLAVLDVDSASVNRFSPADKDGLEKVIAILVGSGSFKD